MVQVVLVLDQREQFGRHVGGRKTASRTESRDECVRQLRNLGINVEVRPNLLSRTLNMIHRVVELWLLWLAQQRFMAIDSDSSCVIRARPSPSPPRASMPATDL